jgi:hypothetical protein
VNTVMDLRVPLNAGNFVTALGTISFAGSSFFHGLTL